jgi:hypothetical protein
MPPLWDHPGGGFCCVGKIFAWNFAASLATR